MKLELTPDAQEMLSKSAEERMDYIAQNTWIDYPNAEFILNQFENLLRFEKNKHRITSHLLVGSTHNGKTSILHRFMELHPAYDLFQDNTSSLTKEFFDQYEATSTPVLYLMAPSEPSESRLYSQILRSMHAPYKEGDSIEKKLSLVEYYLKFLNVEVLIIDEIHNFLSGSTVRQKQVLNAIKNLSNQLQIPILLAGTKDALRAFGSDRQLINRFRPTYIKKWKFDQEYINFLATLLTTIPLKKESDILQAKIRRRILEFSDGCIGDIVALIKHAAIIALENKQEKITEKDIIEAATKASLENLYQNIELKDV